MTKRTALILPGLIALAIAPSARAATPPPDLAALEQQMAALKISTLRFDLQEDVEIPALGALLGKHGGSPLVFVVAGEGVASTAPEELEATAGLGGLPQSRLRVVGGEAYEYRPSAARFDGHRPWVSRPAKTGEAAPLGSGGPLAGTAPGPQGTFGGLVEELNGALSITESGPATVDDQRVIEFDAALNPAQLLERLSARAKGRLGGGSNPLEGLGEAVKPSGKHRSEPEISKLELEVFIAPNGLPVRTRVTVQLQKTTVIFRVDTLATGIPVEVTAPPAAKVIGEAALVRLERRRVARLLVRARRCRGKRNEGSCLTKTLRG
ncbi:MAG TPA: hypothetical protein VN618_15580 [Solirubrobacteraceae bacterium]|nr:hypothetical protein [Solirubrobacteraceae bacterium]